MLYESSRERVLESCLTCCVRGAWNGNGRVPLRGSPLARGGTMKRRLNTCECLFGELGTAPPPIFSLNVTTHTTSLSSLTPLTTLRTIHSLHHVDRTHRVASIHSIDDAAPTDIHQRPVTQVNQVSQHNDSTESTDSIVDSIRVGVAPRTTSLQRIHQHTLCNYCIVRYLRATVL